LKPIVVAAVLVAVAGAAGAAGYHVGFERGASARAAAAPEAGVSGAAAPAGPVGASVASAAGAAGTAPGTPPAATAEASAPGPVASRAPASSSAASIASTLGTPAAGPSPGATPARPTPLAPPAPAPLPPTRARAKFDAKAHGYGVLPHGTVVRHTFHLENAGQDPLEIREVKPGCGCSGATCDKKALAPGESAEIAVTFDTGQKPAPQKGKGPLSTYVTVHTNDPAERDMGPGASRLTLSCEVVARFQVTPAHGVMFPGIQRGAPSAVTASVEVLRIEDAAAAPAPAPGTPAAPAALALKLIEAPPGVEVAAIRPVERAGRRGAAIDLRLLPGAPAGALDGTLRLATGDAEQPELLIKVRGSVQPAVQAVPQRLTLGGDAVSRPIRISSRRPQQVLLAIAVPDGGGPAPVAVSVAAGPSVLVTPVGGAGARAGTGEVRIFLADPEEPFLRVPYALRDPAEAKADDEARRAAGVNLQSELDLGEIDPARIFERIVNITTTREPALDIQDVRVEPEGFVTARTQVMPRAPGAPGMPGMPGGPAMPGAPAAPTYLFLRPTGTAPGPFAARVSFAPRPGEPRLGLTVSGRLSPRLHVEPSGLVARAGAPPVAVALRRRDGGKLKLLSARDPAGVLDVRIETDAGPLVRFGAAPRADAAAPAGGGTVTGEIVVTTDAPDGGEVRVPYVVVRTAGR
jgi:hypothetical protein